MSTSKFYMFAAVMILAGVGVAVFALPHGEAKKASCIKLGEAITAGEICCKGLVQSSGPNAPVCTTCGNGKCEKSETSTSCPQDCKPPCVKKGQPVTTSQTCCAGLAKEVKNPGANYSMICSTCGNNVCDKGETYQSCYHDCSSNCAAGGTASGRPCCPGYNKVMQYSFNCAAKNKVTGCVAGGGNFQALCVAANDKTYKSATELCNTLSGGAYPHAMFGTVAASCP